MLMMADRLPELMGIQAQAISNFKIDKVTVWDSGSAKNAGDGKSIGNLVRDYATSLPPLHDLMKMTGIVGPGILGKSDKQEEPEVGPKTENDTPPVAPVEA